MKTKKILTRNLRTIFHCVPSHLLVAIYLAIVVFFPLNAFSQNKPLIKRTNYRNDSIEFGAGGTISLVGAPLGSVSIEGWQKNVLAISAEIEVQATNESDLALLSSVDGFILDESFSHISILTVGTHDRSYLKKLGKKIPKYLLDIPFKVDYKIQVPRYADLDISVGRGDFKLSNVDGLITVRSVEGNGDLDLTAGTINAIFARGDVTAKFNARSWRGRHVDIQVANGNLNALFLPNFSADIDASVLRSGTISNSIANLKSRDRTTFSDKRISARAGNGGTGFSFTVGDGTIILAYMKE